MGTYACVDLNLIYLIVTGQITSQPFQQTLQGEWSWSRYVESLGCISVFCTNSRLLGHASLNLCVYFDGPISSVARILFDFRIAVGCAVGFI